MYVATVVDMPASFGKHLPDLGKIRRARCDIFHSEGLFSPMGDRGHSLIVLYEDFTDFQIFAAGLTDLTGMDVFKGFCYFGDRNSPPKGNRRAEVMYTPIKSNPKCQFVENGGLKERGYAEFLQRLGDYRNYLKDRGDLFTCPGADARLQFFHSELIITQPDVVLFGHTQANTKVYNELKI